MMTADTLKTKLPEGLLLQYLPTNQAYVITFGTWDGPILKGPAPLEDIVDWYTEHYC